MIKIKNRFINEDHIVKVKRKGMDLLLYLTSTITNKTRYEPAELKTQYEADKIWNELKAKKDFIVFEREIFNRKHIVEMCPILDFDLPSYQIRITTIENAVKKKRKYQVLDFISEMKQRRALAYLHDQLYKDV